MTAEKKGIRWLIIPSVGNPLEGTLVLRDLVARENSEALCLEEAVAQVRAALDM